MLKAASEVDWTPDYAGKRMENWLHNMGDWNISRKRYWGLVAALLRVRRCGEVTRGKSSQAVARTGGQPRGGGQPARTAPPLGGRSEDKVSQVRRRGVAHTRSGRRLARRGHRALLTLGYLDDPEYWRKWFPADWVSEMREQIRLWFYSMLIMSVTLEDTAPYKAVLTYEKVHDEHGRPMHKSWGNAIWFDDAAEKMGADVMRWMYCSANTTREYELRLGSR